jgi:hypothetical protein
MRENAAPAAATLFGVLLLLGAAAPAASQEGAPSPPGEGEAPPLADSAEEEAVAEEDDEEACKRPAYKDDRGTELCPSLTLEGAYFAQANSWYGRSRDNLGEHSDRWAEGALTASLKGALALGERGGSLYGELAALGALSGLGPDAAGSAIPNDNPRDYSTERYYAGWRSGELFQALGTDAIDLSIGKQNYQIG